MSHRKLIASPTPRAGADWSSIIQVTPYLLTVMGSRARLQPAVHNTILLVIVIGARAGQDLYWSIQTEVKDFSSMDEESLFLL